MTIDPRITPAYRKWIADISMWSVGGQLWVAAKDRFVDSNYDKQGRPIVNAFVTHWNQEDIGFWSADYACAQSIGLAHGEDWDESDLPLAFYDECLCAALEYFDAQHEKATIMLDQWDVPEGDTQ
tara:strand:+ start:847 stop:1221 length:375 start_codon:yes stop_codon:yes gene_type:complete